MPNIQEVSAALPLLTPYRMPTDTVQAQTLYDLAETVADADGFGGDNPLALRAYCYLVADMLSYADGSATKTSEHLGAWSVSYRAASGAGRSVWLEAYRALCPAVSAVSAVEISDDYPRGGGV